MVKLRRVVLSLALASLVAVGVDAPVSGRDGTGIRPVFETTIAGPSLLAFCAGRLWVYSAPRRSLFRIDPVTGQIGGEQKLSSESDAKAARKQVPLQSLSCWQERRLVLAERSGALTVWEAEAGEGKPRSRHLAPTSDLRGLHCDARECVVIGKSALRSADLKTWKTLALAPSREVGPVIDHSRENPFWNWRDQLDLSEGAYTKVRTDSSGVLFALDALRAAVTVLPASGEGARARKWGVPGHFEGELMTPRGLAVLKGGQVAISDTGLKLVFVFDAGGGYRGSISADGKGRRFEYPLDLAVSGDTLFVADFLGGRVFALDLALASWAPRELPKSVDELLVKDLFQDPVAQARLDASRCLSCHDGTRVNSLHAFGAIARHHPVGVRLKPEMLGKKMELPLGPGKTVSCNSCHDGHHGSHPGVTVSALGKSVKVKEMPWKLRLPVRALCAQCHVERAASATNHLDLFRHGPPGNAVQVVSCDQCHRSHGTLEQLLASPAPQLCLGCHTERSDRVHERAGARGPKESCLSCHRVHRDRSSSGQLEQPKLSPQGVVACVACHREMGERFGDDNPHLSPDSAQTKKKGASVCLDCHRPHHAPLPVTELCVSCHRDRQQGHRALIAITDTDRARGVHLRDDRINCLTCHEPHGRAGQPKYLREKEPLLNFCASCHGERAPGLFEEYHSRGGHGASGARRKSR